MQQYKTPQEEFWAGEFGNEYILRNIGNNLITLELLFSSVCRKGA